MVATACDQTWVFILWPNLILEILAITAYYNKANNGCKCTTTQCKYTRMYLGEAAAHRWLWGFPEKGVTGGMLRRIGWSNNEIVTMLLCIIFMQLSMCRFGGTILQFSSIQNVRPYLDTLRSTAKKGSRRQTGLESTFGPFLESWPSGRENVINVEMFPKNKASCGMTYGVTEMLKKTVAIVFFATFLNFLCEIYPFFSECSESLTWPVGGSDISGWDEKVLLHHLSRSSNSRRWNAEKEGRKKEEHPV